MEDVSIIGIELAKRDFQVDGPKAEGRVAYRSLPNVQHGSLARAPHPFDPPQGGPSWT